MHFPFGYISGGWLQSCMNHQVSMKSCRAIGGVHNAAPSKAYEPGNSHDQTMYIITRQVYMGNIQAANWHNVGTARYHGLEHCMHRYGAGMHHMGPTGSTP